jgi:hypothetical protein
MAGLFTTGWWPISQMNRAIVPYRQVCHRRYIALVVRGSEDSYGEIEIEQVRIVA